MPIRQQFPTDDEFLKALRDWFAGQALSATTMILKDDSNTDLPVRIAYALADAMMAERENRWRSG